MVAALVEKDGKFLLTKEVLESGKEYWIVPGGGLEFGESLDNAVKREIKEETNLDIEIKEFAGFQEAIVPQYNYHTVIFFYRALSKNESLLLEDNILEARFFTKEEIKNLNLVDSSRRFLERIEII